jgi:uncharacterized protein YndB with AHSA1/START domain
MARIVVETLIPATPETVWADLARLDTHAEWMADAERVEFASDRRTGIGTEIRVATRVGPFRTSDLMRFTAWEPPRTMAVDHHGLFRGEGRFVLDPDPAGTRFRWEETIRFPWFLGGPLGARVARPVLTAIWRGNLRRLGARFG